MKVFFLLCPSLAKRLSFDNTQTHRDNYQETAITMFSPEIGDIVPDFIITGVNKCGTSAASRFLFNHPDLSKAHGEPNFFNIDKNYERGFSWYSSQFKKSKNGTLQFEKTPTYYKSINGQKRMHKMNPNMKMVTVGIQIELFRSIFN